MTKDDWDDWGAGKSLGLNLPRYFREEYSDYLERVNKILNKQESDPYGKDPHEPGAKMDAGKVQAGLLLDFSRALWAVAEVGTYGANKYTRRGWQFVPNAEERYEDALMRHLLKLRNEPVDAESGLDVLAQVAWNALAVLELKLQREAGE